VKDTLKLLPLLLLYIVIVVLANRDALGNDEARYLMFAGNLSQGYYSPQNEVNLWSGPGYPIILLPFVFFKIPLFAAKLLNALFMFTAVLYFYHALRFYMNEGFAILFSYLLGMYPPILRYIHRLLTEQFAVLLICAFLFHFCALYQKERRPWPNIVVASAYLGYLALTKVFFGYVIICALVLFLLFYLWKRKRDIRRTLLVYICALLFCTPYLFYTHSLTGKIFYWGQSGGIALYLMSTTYENGLGDWNVLRKHKNEIYKEFRGVHSVQLDEEFKKRAIKNIIKHPGEYFNNWLANIGRYLFNYPFSYEVQKVSTYFYILPNMFLVLISVLCIYPTYKGQKIVPYEIYALIVFGMIAFGGSSLIFVMNRQFWPIVPVLTLWISFTLARVVKIEIRA
jgi:hypothetical protein